ncbi:NUDIX hydrolase [Liquorilactobacillus mali]|uniref:NUDIX hydrolase n=1 Tax=Liquorilactobacillus mali TaxID=1618 RepID=A0A0R2FRR8_9LACO|nr:NUDIX hydrolase [Liquorilactobacillus mali]KRN31177.1 NUDIX hydrolase [Liquorilactobacillus mali]MDN7145784.1 NUDIX hydrolase [Liquorilactobacillus mali]
MNNLKIQKVKKKISVTYSGTSTILSVENQRKITSNWNSINRKKRYFNGDIYTVNRICSTQNEIIFSVNKTDYAHYLYSNSHNLQEEDCKIIFTSVVLLTNDNKIILGKMGTSTSSPGRIQCIGGNIDANDLEENKFNLRNSICREINEEIGISVPKNKLTPAYLKTDSYMKYTAIIFWINLDKSWTDIKNLFQRHTNALSNMNRLPELQNLLPVNLNEESISDFCKENKNHLVDYLPPLLNTIVLDKKNT